MRLLIRYLRLEFVAVVFGFPAWTLAHDIPNARIERSTQLVLTPGRLIVEYEVVLAELTLAQDLRQLDAEPFVGDRPALFRRYALVAGPLNARGFLIHVDDREVDLRVIDFTIVVEDHPRIRFRFEATVPAQGRLALIDTNYASASGATRLALAVDPGMIVTGDRPPARVESIPWRSPWELSDQEENQTKRLRIDYRPRLAVESPPPGPATTAQSAVPPPARGAGLTRLLDQRSWTGAIGWWLTAFVLGMVHAIQPGHGKTLVAAASLDETGGMTRGVALGLVTAGCHLIGVVAVAGCLWVFETNRFGTIHLAIARTSGTLIAAVGLYRVGRHLAGFTAGHAHPAALAPGIWSLGLAAGFVPCWDAVALVVLASSIGQLGWGLILLVAFSLGLAMVLISVGWAAGRLRRTIAGRAWSSPSQRWLGFGSGVVLAAIGIGLLTS